MATAYKTPGVYVEEISKFPPSVAQVETAIPAFVGYTEQAIVDGNDFHSEEMIRPIKIKSLPEFELFFGGAPDPTTIEIDLKDDNSVRSAKVNGVNLLYDSIRMFYANGGGDCYIVSVGAYNSAPEDIEKQDLLDGLAALIKVDQPTLLVIPEVVHLDEADAGEVHVAMLAQCNKLQDRFAVLDIVNGNKEVTPTSDPILTFRDNVGMSFLKYGAAYYPWIITTLPFKIDYDAVVGGTFTKNGNPLAGITSLFNSGMVGSIVAIDSDIASKGTIELPEPGEINAVSDLSTFADKLLSAFQDFYELNLADADANDSSSAASTHKKFISDGSVFQKLLSTLYDYNHYSHKDNGDTTWDNMLMDVNLFAGFSAYTFTPSPANSIYTKTATARNAAPYFEALASKLGRQIDSFYAELVAVRKNRTESLAAIDPVYKGIVDVIRKQSVVLPPSGAVVGAYAMVDRERGVWKSPANVSLTAVKGPVVSVTHEDQESMNVDTEAGKSVNAIRAFTGKGTLIWGARTLAGNDNEWRYVSVRRFFNMVEESVKKATSQFVFEPNDANTWVKVRAMIENFLTLQWRAGALAGAKQDDAFYVRVGLGQTMTAEDVLNGYMHVEIGMAVVRPAEFIVLKFSHKMQES